MGYQELHDDVNAYSLDETDVDSRLVSLGGSLKMLVVEKYVMQV